MHPCVPMLCPWNKEVIPIFPLNECVGDPTVVASGNIYFVGVFVCVLVSWHIQTLLCLNVFLAGLKDDSRRILCCPSKTVLP